MLRLMLLPMFAADDGAGGGGGGGAGDPPKTVAYENFQAVVTAKTGLEGKVRTLEAENQTLKEKAATVDTLSSEVTKWKGEAEKAQGAFATYTEFSGALGTTDTDVIGSFDAKYRALPEQDRPTRAAWVEALKAKPEEAPSLLRPWLAPAQQEGGAGGRPPQPRPPGTKPTPTAAPNPVAQEEVARIRAACVASGNWQPWKDFKKAHGLP